jgi:hypothetical protein
MEGDIKKTEVLARLRNMLAVLSSIDADADLPALAFLIGMVELEASQSQANFKRKSFKK